MPPPFRRRLFYFNPLGRKTETSIAFLSAVVNTISIHSVARPRQRMRVEREENGAFQSTRSQDRDLSPFTFLVCVYNFNPLGRKTETWIKQMLQRYLSISIHSVARPRLHYVWYLIAIVDFNPLGRKTETGRFVFPGIRIRDFNPLGRKTETYPYQH